MGDERGFSWLDVERMGLKKIPDLGRAGMPQLELQERAAPILQFLRWMAGVPLDERRRDTVERHSAVRGNRELPLIRSSRHGFGLAQRSRGGPDVVGPGNPGRKARRGLASIEPEPAGPSRRRCHRVRGNDFEIQGRAELEQAVMRSHTLVLAAGLRYHAERLAHVLDAGGKRRRGDDEVVDYRGRDLL